MPDWADEKAAELARTFQLGFRTALTCPDVSVAEYEGVMAYRIAAALLAQHEASDRAATGRTLRECESMMNAKLESCRQLNYAVGALELARNDVVKRAAELEAKDGTPPTPEATT